MDPPDESTYAKGRWQNIVDNDRSPPFKMKLMSVEQIEGIARWNVRGECVDYIRILRIMPDKRSSANPIC